VSRRRSCPLPQRRTPASSYVRSGRYGRKRSQYSRTRTWKAGFSREAGAPETSCVRGSVSRGRLQHDEQLSRQRGDAEHARRIAIAGACEVAVDGWEVLESSSTSVVWALSRMTLVQVMPRRTGRPPGCRGRARAEPPCRPDAAGYRRRRLRPGRCKRAAAGALDEFGLVAIVWLRHQRLGCA